MPPKKKKKVYVDPATRAANRALIRDQEQQDRQSSWEPPGNQAPHVGVVEGTDHVASFKQDAKTGQKQTTH